MAGALVIIGLLGFLGCVVWLIVALFKHRRKRWPAIGIGVAIVLFIVGGTLLPKPSKFEEGIESWQEHNFQKARHLLSEVEKEDEGYDSAQILLKQLPDTACAYYLVQAKEKLEAEEFDDALEVCEEALGFKPKNAGTEKLQKKIRAAASLYWIAEARTQLKDEEFTAASGACDKALSYNPDSRTAKSLQKTIKAKEAKKREAELLAARKKFAKDYEYSLLDEGIEATVTVHGSKATTLKVRWILVSKVIVHEYNKNPEFFQSLRDLGFKKFILTDGYDFSWVWDLN